MLQSLAQAKAQNIYETTIKIALPILAEAAGNSNSNESWMASSAIELLTSLIEGAPTTGLGDGFFAVFAPHLFSTMSVAEDRDLLQVRGFLPLIAISY